MSLKRVLHEAEPRIQRNRVVCPELLALGSVMRLRGEGLLDSILPRSLGIHSEVRERTCAGYPLYIEVDEFAIVLNDFGP